MKKVINVTGTNGHEKGLKRWLTTTHHTDIGVMYLTTAFAFFILAAITAMLMRIEVAIPGETLVGPETYNSMFTTHGTTMIFFFVIPALVGFANYLVPILCGAPDMAFPRLNALSYWIFLPAGIMVWLGNPAIGWTAYAPLSVYESGVGVDLWLFGLTLLGVSSIAGSVNFMVTIFLLRKPDVKFKNMSLFLWAVLVTAGMILVATPVLASGFIMTLLDRNLGTTFFSTSASASGEPMLWQHLFWFYSHPAVYIMILPIMGAISVIIPKMSRQPIFGYNMIVYSTLAIGGIGFAVWAHHMFTTGISFELQTGFMVATMIIAVPTGIKVFSWIATMWGGHISFKTPMLFALGFLSLFIIGGLSGVFNASVPADIQIHDTYWIVAHLHYVLFGGSTFGIFSAVYFFYPTMTGRMYNETLGKIHFVLTFIGFNLTYFVLHILGLEGMPRRIFDPPEQYIFLTQFSTVGAMILGMGQLPFFYNMISSLKRGEIAPEDPWGEPEDGDSDGDSDGDGDEEEEEEDLEGSDKAPTQREKSKESPKGKAKNSY
jgi:cytochrome c oxidase subunit 1